MKRLILLFISLSSLISHSAVSSDFSCASASASIQKQNAKLVEVSKFALAPNFVAVNDAPKLNRDRFNHIVGLWQKTCPGFTRQNVPRSPEDNLVCRIQGESDDVLVVGAHFDKVAKGDGVADNWSGMMILNALLNDTFNKHTSTSSSELPRLTIDFVAFAAEERGLLGSKAYIKQVDRTIVKMLNIDTIGLRNLIVSSDSDPELICRIQNIAKALAIPLSVERLRDISGDWQSFSQKGIAAIGLHSVNKKTIRRIHHQRDKAGNVDLNKMSDAYQIIRLLLRSQLN